MIKNFLTTFLLAFFLLPTAVCLANCDPALMPGDEENDNSVLCGEGFECEILDSVTSCISSNEIDPFPCYAGPRLLKCREGIPTPGSISVEGEPTWGDCEGEILSLPEDCGNELDNSID